MSIVDHHGEVEYPFSQKTVFKAIIEAAPKINDSFKIYIGNKECSYCSTLYLYDNRLWESVSAIRSYDYGASELLEKE